MITLFKSVVYLKMSCLLSPITWRIEKEGYLTLFRCRVVTSSWIKQVIICCFEVLQVRWITCIWFYSLLLYIIKNTSLCVCVPQLWTRIHFNIRIVCPSWSIHIACLWRTFVKCRVIDFRQCGAGGPLPDLWLYSFETLSVSVVADSKHKRFRAARFALLRCTAWSASAALTGACEGTLACSTCHLIFEDHIYEKLDAITDEENDMLDLAYGLTDRWVDFVG